MKTESILAAFPYLYELSPTNSRSSYAMKHDVERLLGEYCSMEELQTALMSSVRFERGVPRRDNGPTEWAFYVKPKFEMVWLFNQTTTRPKGARKTHWEAYQTALAWATQHQASHSAPTASGSR